MNKVIYRFPAASFHVACRRKTKKLKKRLTEANVSVSGKTYACPMQCEGDKTYTEAGKCPVCKMELQEVALGRNRLNSTSTLIINIKLFNYENDHLIYFNSSVFRT
jgi:transcription initiation factor IIE alpha subunit